MAERLQGQGSLESLARELWQRRSLPPSWLLDRTPHEILFLFGSRPAPEEPDRLAELRHWNHEAAKRGVKPRTPAWLVEEMKRAKRE